MSANTADDERWVDMARIVESLGSQVQALADAGGREAEHVGGLGQATRSLQEALQSLSPPPGARGRAPQDQPGSNSLVGKNMVPDGLANKTGLKQWSHRHELVAGAHDEAFKVLLDWAEAQGMNALVIVLGSSGVVDAPRPAQHLYASLLMFTETGAETHSFVDNTPGENGWRRGDDWPSALIQRRCKRTRT